MRASNGPDRATLLAFAVVCLIAGSNFVAVRFSNAELLPFWGATLRFAIATALFFAIVAIRRAPLPGRDALPQVALFGVLAFSASYALLYFALQTVHAPIAAVLLALVPLLTLFFAAAHGVERLRPAGIAGAVVSLVGIAVIYRDQIDANAPAIAVLALILAAASIAESGVLLRRLPRADPFATNAVGLLAGVVVLAAITLIAREPLALPSSSRGWIAVGYLAFAGSVPLFALYLYVVRRWSASGASYQFVLAPLVTIVVAALLAGEAVTGAFLVGGALVVLGVHFGALRR